MIPRKLFLGLTVFFTLIAFVVASHNTAFAASYFTLPIIGYSPGSWFDHTSPYNPGTSDVDNYPSLMTKYDGTTGASYNGHNAIDYPTGTSGKNVYAAAGGTIGFIGWENPNDHSQMGGFTIRVKHTDWNVSTYYAHLTEEYLISVGQTVSRGQLIAHSDNTGNSSGPHLHFGVFNSLTGWRGIDPYGWSGGGSDPWTYDQGYLWTTNPPSAPPTNDSLSDIATFYDYGSCETRIHSFLSTGSSFDYQGPGGWWAATGYCAGSIVATASGDFDGDGDSDIAAFYDYGNNETRIHVFKADPANKEFDYSGPGGWWSSTSFTAANIKYALGGDFDGNGKADIAVFYGTGGATTIYVFASNGSSFERQTWWSVPSGYSLSSTYGAAAGDYDYDGDSDLALLYDYGSGASRIHVWLADGATFYYQTNNGWWRVDSGYTASSVKHFLAGIFNTGGLVDLALFYDYGNGAARIHVFLSTGSSFSYQGSSGWWSTSSGYSLSAVPFALAGQYNVAGTVRDITTIYDYPGSETRLHEFLGTGSAFSYQGPTGWWSATGYDTVNIKQAVTGYYGAP